MHRHGYQGRKFHRERDQRRALMKSLSEALIQHGSIETTLPKAKELRPHVEKLITKAKKGDLHNRRQIISQLQTVSTAHYLVDEIAPKLSNRTSGYLRITPTRTRRGDGAQLAQISFVDDISSSQPVVTPADKEAPSKSVAKEKPSTTAASKKATTSKTKTATKKA